MHETPWNSRNAQPGWGPRWSIQGAETGAPATWGGMASIPLRMPPGEGSLVRLPKSTADPAGCGRLAAYTWHYGKQPWIAGFAPAMAGWARRNLVKLTIWREPPSKDPAAPCALAAMVEDFLSGDADWMIYLDADVMIHPLAPHPLEGGLQPGVWATPDLCSARELPVWQAWVAKHFQRDARSCRAYSNDGVWLVDRASAERFLPYLQRPLMPSANHPHFFNLCLWDAVTDGKIEWHPLSAVWNRLPSGRPGRDHRSWFYHCSGTNKNEALAAWQMAGFLPQPRLPMTIKPWPAEPRHEDLIAIPFHLEGDPMKGESLRYLLRSIGQHWKHPWPVVIFGTARPEWLDESIFQLEPSYPQAMLRAFSMARRVLWINDDMYFLKDTTVDDHQVPLRFGDLVPRIPSLLASDNRWQRGRGHLASRLHHEQGMDEIPDFSVHYPFLFERDKARAVFDHFGIWHKYPMEVAYHGLHRSVGRPADEFATFETRDAPGKRWLNVQDPLEAGEEWGRWMADRFPNPSRWEVLP